MADPIAQEGLDLLREGGVDVDVRTGLKPAELEASIHDYDALIVRSETQVSAEVLAAGKLLQIVGRAGIGVDNIDVEAATRQGVLVVNAPTSNSIAAAEHSLALMLSLARHVPRAHASLKGGRWSRSEFVGTELRGKTLGIIGLGRVGSEVARRAKAFEMRLIADDPFVSTEHARHLGVEMVPLDDLLQRADFITVHVPLTGGTERLIGRQELAKVKPTVRIINAARGGIIEEQALYEAVESGRVAGAAIDVFSVEPAGDSVLLKSDRIIVTPHLGASTAEAQTNVAIEVVEQIVEVLEGRPARHAVNAPMVLPEALAVLTPFVAVGHLAGKVAIQLAEGQLNSVTIDYAGDIAQHDTLFLKAAVIGGLLAPVSEERVNAVNVNMIVSQRGMKVVERKEEPSETYRNLLTVELTTSAGTTTVSGTSVNGRSHIVRLNDYRMDIAPGDGYMLLIENPDSPGMIGAVGTLAGENDVNISFMEVGRLEKRGRAMMALGLDEPMPESAMSSILAMPGITSAKQVKV